MVFISKKIIIGTRPSNLAYAQACIVANQLRQAYPDMEYEIKKISTKGDRVLDKPMREIEGKGIFIKEIEVALLNKEIDMAVHSYKDLPTVLPDKLEVSVIPERANPLDTLVARDNKILKELPCGASLGTGSLRRKSQLLAYRSDLNIIPIRGNIGTRIEKIKEMNLDGIILAAAGLERLGWKDKITEYIDPSICLPAPRQGAIAIETRKEKDSDDYA